MKLVSSKDFRENPEKYLGEALAQGPIGIVASDGKVCLTIGGPVSLDPDDPDDQVELPKNTNYSVIAKHYEQCFEKHGPNHRGVDWPNQHDLHKRFQIMTDVILQKGMPCTLLDFGCGTGLLLDWLTEKEMIHAINYSGCDISEKFTNFCKQKYQEEDFFLIDIGKTPELLSSYDYIVMNGVFTMKLGLSQTEMWDHFTNSIAILFQKAKKGIAFNVMSKYVDWERDDLFHVSLDQLAAFLTEKLSRHFVIRNDYGLYEYTVYLYKEAN